MWPEPESEAQALAVRLLIQNFKHVVQTSVGGGSWGEQAQERGMLAATGRIAGHNF